MKYDGGYREPALNNNLAYPAPVPFYGTVQDFAMRRIKRSFFNRLPALSRMNKDYFEGDFRKYKDELISKTEKLIKMPGESLQILKEIL